MSFLSAILHIALNKNKPQQENFKLSKTLAYLNVTVHPCNLEKSGRFPNHPREIHHRKCFDLGI